MPRVGKFEAFVDGTVARIPLSGGGETIVDANDLDIVCGPKWRLWGRTPYLYVARKQIVGGKAKTIKMHRLIMGAQDGFHVDHLNGDKLDNRRGNLRCVTPRQNNRNMPSHRNGKIVGIYHDKRRGSYEARIILGTFKSLEEAKSAQDRALQILSTAGIDA